jgi:hypothetical protein
VGLYPALAPIFYRLVPLLHFSVPRREIAIDSPDSSDLGIEFSQPRWYAVFDDGVIGSERSISPKLAH